MPRKDPGEPHINLRTAVASTACLFSAGVAFAGIDIVSETSVPARKKLVAAVEETAEVVIDTRVLTKAAAAAPWVVDVQETAKTEAALEEEAPLREEMEIWTAITTDCNGNGISDASDISAGAMDADGDGVPDSCEFAIGDLNLNGVIDQQDLSILLGWWGIANPLYGDNKVDGTDMGIMLGRYGAVVY